MFNVKEIFTTQRATGYSFLSISLRLETFCFQVIQATSLKLVDNREQCLFFFTPNYIHVFAALLRAVTK